jgi:hypothetical protein
LKLEGEEALKCDFCGNKLTKEEESNFVHYPSDKICDACMVKIGLVSVEEEKHSENV